MSSADFSFLNDSSEWKKKNAHDKHTNIEKKYLKKKKMLAERGFDPRTSGLWAQHASTAPLCSTSSSSNYNLDT